MQGLRLQGEGVASVLSRAPQWVTGLLVVALGAQAALIVADLAGAGTGPAARAPAAVTAITPGAGIDLTALLGANLFGRSVPAGSADGGAPVTSMALVLVGVLADDNPQRGLAILGPSATAARVYLTGSSVPGGAKLHAVYADRVLLDRGGVIESLMLPRRQAVGGPAPPPPPSMGIANRMQQLVTENPGLIGDIIRPQPVLADGRQRGYRVYPGPNQDAFNRLGLRPGDMVTAINGTALDDPARGGEIFGTLSNAGEARVTVMRNGRQQDLVLNLAQVVAEAEKMAKPAAPAGPPPQGQSIPPPAAQ